MLFTDGLVESRSADIDEGFARLLAAASSAGTSDPDELCDRLLAELTGAHRADDIALLVLTRRSTPRGHVRVTLYNRGRTVHLELGVGMSNPLTLAPAPRSEAAERVRGEVRDFLAEELAAGTFSTHVDTWLSGVDPEFSRKLGERGWLGMTWPKQYGGHERTAMERYAVTEELLAAGAPVAAHWIADRQSGPNLLQLRHRGAAAGDPAAHRRAASATSSSA